LLLAVLSVIPTFLGPEAATNWFTSVGGATLWWGFGLLMVGGIVAIASLRKRFGLLAMHVGMLLVITGAMWGSPLMHRLRAGLWDDERITDGFVIVDEGESTDVVFDSFGKEIGHLPFEVYLEDFWIEYYPVLDTDPWQFTVEALNFAGPFPQQQTQKVRWALNKVADLPLCDVRMTVTDYQLGQYGEGSDAPVLPEAVVGLERGDKTAERSFQPKPGMEHGQLPLAGLYENANAWHAAGSPTLHFHPPLPVIRDYKSAVVARKDETELARKTIEVNAPLHVGGYHFYQYDYDHSAGRYTVLSMVSDSGLSCVYVGFILLFGGLIWHVLAPRRQAAQRMGGS